MCASSYGPPTGSRLLHIAVRARKDAELSVPTDSPGADFPHHGAEIDGGYTQSSCDTVINLWFESPSLNPVSSTPASLHIRNVPLSSVPTCTQEICYTAPIRSAQ